MYCIKCGKEINNSSNFCRYCGTDLRYCGNSKEIQQQKNYMKKTFTFPDKISVEEEVDYVNKWLLENKARVLAIRLNSSHIHHGFPTKYEAGFTYLEISYDIEPSNVINQIVYTQSKSKNADLKAFSQLEEWKLNNPDVQVCWSQSVSCYYNGYKRVTVFALIK